MKEVVIATLGDIRKATGSDYCYNYRELPRQASVAQIRSYCADRRQMFAPITKAFDATANSR